MRLFKLSLESDDLRSSVYIHFIFYLGTFVLENESWLRTMWGFFYLYCGSLS